CYTGENHLVIRWGDKQLTWSGTLKRRVSEQTVATPFRLAVGKLDSDALDDVVVLAGSETLIFRGAKGLELAPMLRLPNTSDRFAHVWTRDLDGDGRLDLLMLDGGQDDPDRPLVARFQDARGKFGPEHRLALSDIRAIEVADADDKPGAEILSIDQNAGRAQIHQVIRRDEQSDAPTSSLVQFGFGPGAASGRGRHLATGDVNGDGLADVVVVNGESARMSVYLQDAESGLGAPLHFPGLTGIRGIRLADLDGDGRADLVLASEREKVIALSRWRNDRLTFPASLPTTDTPMAVCLADFDGAGQLDVAYISSERASTFGRGSYSLRKLSFDRDDGWQAGDFNGAETVELTGLRAAPSEMIAMDADRDGRSDLMIIAQNSPALFLATDPRGAPKIAESASSNRLGIVSPGEVTVAKLDGQAILIAQRNFARRVKLNLEGQWEVADQFNAASPTAKIVGVAALDLDDDDEAEIVLVDTGTKQLRFLKKQDGVYRAWKQLEIGPFGYQSLEVGDFNGDERDDLLLFSPTKFGVVFAGGSGPALRRLGGFETKMPEARLSDLVLGDLGGGGEPEIALIDANKKRVELITSRKGEWRSALRFPIIETSQFNAGGGLNPRETIIADVTGDGLDDLIFIAHDRVLLYPQDP
ncbi:MAG: VCBS repeat-containing protein, partial [Planctomycetales bacterium]